MPEPLIASLPLDLVLSSGYVIRLTALDESTGATVTGVRATDVAFQVRPINTDGSVSGQSDAPSPLLVPTDEAA